LLRLGLVAFVLLAATAGWLALRAASARDHLERARAEVDVLQDRLLDADPESARAALARLQSSARSARSDTSGLVWRIAARVPGAGRTLTTAAGVARATDDLAREVLPPLVQASEDIDPADLRVAGDKVALAPMQRAAGALVAAREKAEAASIRLRALPRGRFVLGAVASARRELRTELDELIERVRTAEIGARLGPTMLGADGPRRYLLAIVNPAEQRGTGGLIGAYGILSADRGDISLEKVGSNTDLESTYPRPVVSLGEEYDSRYDRFGADSFWLSGNFSPHFPYADAVWRGLWKAQTGQQLDGTVQIDPVGLSYALAVTGPARLPNGETVSAETIVPTLLRDAYARFPENAPRDAYFQTVARAAYEQITSGAGDPKALLSALGRAAGEGHLQVASRHADEAELLAGVPIGGVLPSGEGPFVQLVTNNVAGSKLDYYVRRSVRHETSVVGGERRVKLTVDLASSAPTSGLPDYVVARADLKFQPGPVRGQNNLYTSLYLGPDEQFVSATLDGKPIALESEVERGHTVLSLYLTLNPGQSRQLVVELLGTEAGALDLRPVVVRRQPHVVEDTVVVVGPEQ
jgi:hypothetical protein